MRGFRFLAVTVALLALCSPWVEGQDPTKPKDSKDPAPKMRGQLPQNWGKLGLSDEQKQKIYEAQSKHRAKIDSLQKQIVELKNKEKKDLEAILTDAQKSRLREIASNKAPADTKSKDK